MPGEHAATAAAKSRARARFNRAMKLARRIHLYTGLFMTPWVFLYGFTALLFNHPEAFPDARIVHFEAAGGPLAGVPRPTALAEEVVKALNAPGDAPAKGDQAAKAGSYRLIRPAEARYDRDFFATVSADGREHFLRMDMLTGEGTIRTQRKQAEKPSPFAAGATVKLAAPPMEAVTKALPGILEREGIPGDKTVDRSFPPDLSFLMESDGRAWRVRYNPQSGKLSGRPEAEGDPLSARTYLLRLHLAHEYPSEMNAAWFWAVAVDAMFASMVGWGVTGLLMWWQMKNVRKVGVVVLIASAVAATAVAIGMHRHFTA
jgi:hypothetical protein